MKNRYSCSVGVVLCVCFMFTLSGCATMPNSVSTAQGIESGVQYQYNPEQYVVKSPRQRLEATNTHETYFKNEREALKKRRRALGLNEPNKDEFGLALSGGGIRSNSFQLGLMSGLYETDCLKMVDYISAVSGGSWAAGAYKTSIKRDEEFFKNMDATVRKEDFDDNDKRMHPLFNSYTETLEKIRDVKLAPSQVLLQVRVGFSSQEEWRKMLRKHVLNGEDSDVLLKDLNRGRERERRPYIIFNATHDAIPPLLLVPDTKTSFPFEITADFIGTLADCGNTDYCQSSEPTSESDNNNKYLGVFISTSYKDLSQFRVSHAMAFSGAVAPSKFLMFNLNLLDWKIEIPPTFFDPNLLVWKRKILPLSPPLYRERMVLTDGGHSENLGAFALMERKVPLIIISDASENADRNEELAVLMNHAKKLLGMEIEEVFSKEDLSEEVFMEKVFRKFTYKKDGNDIGTIFYIKPFGYKGGKNAVWDSFGHDEGTLRLRTYLDNAMINSNVKFPTDKTMATEYDHKLIFSYYLLGYFFAIKEIIPELKRAIEEGSVRIPKAKIKAFR